MHEFKIFELKHNNGAIEHYSACKNCGTIEVINAEKEEKVCSGKMHSNSPVKQLNMNRIYSKNSRKVPIRSIDLIK